MSDCYYLIYKLKTSPHLWIVNVMEHPHEFKEKIADISSKEEKYYIIKNTVNDIDYELNFKRFTIFEKNKNCKIITETL